jgi:protein phosphatase
MESTGLTHIGRVREENEDSILLLPELGVFAVADGMGGHRGGKVASQMIVGELRSLVQNRASLQPDDLSTLLNVVNERVHEASLRDFSLEGMGSTCSLLLVRGRQAHVAHVGDSRVYLVRGAEMTQITSDHRAVQELIDGGALTQAEAESHPLRNMLTRSVGVDEEVDVDRFDLELQTGDTLLLCSDGLTSMVGEREIANVLKRADDLDQAAAQLVGKANDSGGQDNISVVLIRV